MLTKNKPQTRRNRFWYTRSKMHGLIDEGSKSDIFILNKFFHKVLNMFLNGFKAIGLLT